MCAAGADGNLTRRIEHVDCLPANSRRTLFAYDFRNRLVTTDGELDYFAKNHYDNLDRVVRAEQYDTTEAGNLIARRDTRYDERGRVYQTVTYAVNAETGDVVGHITSDTWYDASGRPIKEKPGGSARFTKTRYDGLGRAVKTFAGYDVDESSYADATTTAGDTIFEQSETDYAHAGNVIATCARQRMHDAVGTGELQDATAEPRARVTYTAAWYDAAGRQIASADYGTNGRESFTRPETVPERSDTCLVTSTLYNARGEAFCTIDPMGRQDVVAFDDAGRTIETIENYQGGLSQFSRSENGTVPFPADANKTTRMTYTPDGQLATLTAINPTTGDQTTRYVYGSTLVESFVARSDLLRAEIYPDSDDSRCDDGEDQSYDRIEYSYNAQGERKSLRDQNGTVRGFLYDKLGRLLHDFVESLGPGVDGRVRRISRTYGLGGRLEKLTSYTHCYPKTGAIDSQVLFQYSDTGLPSAEYQSHDGPVDMAATPQVQFAYDDTLDGGELVKGLRPTRVIYPNGRIVRYEYGDSGASSSSSGPGDDPDDLLNRVKFIADDDEGAIGTHLAEYTRLGLNTIVRVDYTEPRIRYDLAHGEGSDPYAGLDRFGRVIDLLWRNYGTGEDVVRIRHGYDRAGNRLYREDPVAHAHGVHLDEAYTYDGLYQLKTFVRGALNAQKTAIAAPTFRQAWDFDTTGNWQRFREDKDGDGRWDLDQTRTHNRANELTAFESKVGDLWISPLHDCNGNMIRIPQPKDPTRQFTLRYDPWNRLVRVSDSTGPVADYSYDARNFRILKEVHRDPADPIPGEESFSRYPESRHFYYNSSWQCLEERVSSSPSLPPDSLPADRQFVWGLRYIDDLVLRDRATAPGGALGAPTSALDERLYGLQDPNWNVVAIVDTRGAVAERYTYSPYGKVTILTPAWSASRRTSAFDNTVLYTGRESEAPGQFYCYRARWYHPGGGCFLTRDPVEYDGALSLYVYANASPINRSDPMGRLPPGIQPGIPARLSDDFMGSGPQAVPTPPAPKVIPDRMIIVQTNMQLQPTGGICGTNNFIFRIRLPADAPCDGYLLQYILTWHDTHGCGFLSGSPGPIDTAKQTPKRQFTERLAFIKKGAREEPLGNRSGHDYRMLSFTTNQDTCGWHLARGELKFFCVQPTPDGHVGIGNEPDRWQARVKAGGFAPTVEGRPIWWSKKPVFRDVLLTHAKWNCCATPKDHGTFSWSSGFEGPPIPAGF